MRHRVAKPFCTACATAGLLSLAVPASAATDGEIGIFANPGGTGTTVNIPCNESATLYMYAVLDGASASGMVGAEFAIAQFGAGGFFYLEQPAATVDQVIGRASPPGDGVVLSWNSCQTGTRGKVLLGTLIAFNTGCTGNPTVLQVVKHSQPTNPFFQCPTLTLCDNPVFTRVCTGAVSTGTCPFPPFAPTCQFSTGGSILLTTETVSVNPDADSGQPGEIVFGPAIPNPSRGHASFLIGLPEAASVSLRIFDLAGRRVARVDAGYGSGWHTLEWNGIPEAGRLDSGVYFARLFVDGNPVGGRRLVLGR